MKLAGHLVDERRIGKARTAQFAEVGAGFDISRGRKRTRDGAVAAVPVPAVAHGPEDHCALQIAELGAGARATLALYATLPSDAIKQAELQSRACLKQVSETSTERMCAPRGPLWQGVAHKEAGVGVVSHAPPDDDVLMTVHPVMPPAQLLGQRTLEAIASSHSSDDRGSVQRRLGDAWRKKHLIRKHEDCKPIPVCPQARALWWPPLHAAVLACVSVVHPWPTDVVSEGASLRS